MLVCVAYVWCWFVVLMCGLMCGACVWCLCVWCLCVACVVLVCGACVVPGACVRCLCVVLTIGRCDGATMGRCEAKRCRALATCLRNRHVDQHVKTHALGIHHAGTTHGRCAEPGSRRVQRVTRKLNHCQPTPGGQSDARQSFAKKWYDKRTVLTLRGN